MKAQKEKLVRFTRTEQAYSIFFMVKLALTP